MTARVQNANGVALPNVMVTFTTTRGTVSPAQVATSSSGAATATLTASDTADVTAIAGAVSAHTLVIATTPSGPTPHADAAVGVPQRVGERHHRRAADLRRQFVRGRRDLDLVVRRRRQRPRHGVHHDAHLQPRRHLHSVGIVDLRHGSQRDDHRNRSAAGAYPDAGDRVRTDRRSHLHARQRTFTVSPACNVTASLAGTAIAWRQHRSRTFAGTGPMARPTTGHTYVRYAAHTYTEPRDVHDLRDRDGDVPADRLKTTVDVAVAWSFHRRAREVAPASLRSVHRPREAWAAR